MTQTRRVTSASATHFPNKELVKVKDSEFEVENHQRQQMLIDPEDISGGRTHTAGDVKFKGARKAPTTASLHDLQEPAGGKIAQIDNAVDPSAGYLEKEAGMPVIQGSDEFEDEDEFSTDEVSSGVDDEFSDEDEFTELHSEFEDLGDVQSESGDNDEFDQLEVPVGEESAVQAADDEETPQAFEEETAPGEAVAVVDADEVPEQDDEPVGFATMAKVVHVIRSNRIVASMGPATARKVGMSDVYLTDQFQDVVAHAIETKGLRKGLVQSGFVLAKVKLSGNKVAAKAVEARVTATLNKKVEAMNARQAAMEQCLAIAAVGINRRFFKDTSNELKASLESEFTRAGVRGASRIVQAMFAQHGVSYAKSILTLANKIAEMPEEVRNQYASALDLTNDADFETTEVDSENEDEAEEFDEIPTSVTAALSSPARRDVGVLLKAGLKNQLAMSILSGTQSLV